MFYATRMAAAAAEQLNRPATASLLADYYPQVNRPKAYGLVQMTAYLGGIGTLVGGVVGEALGGRTAFLMIAVPGLLMALLTIRLREPARGGLDGIRAGRTEESHRRVAAPPIRQQLQKVLRIPTLVGISIGLMLVNAGLVGVFFWMPSSIARSYDVGAGTASALTGAVTVVGLVLGTLIGSWAGRVVMEQMRGGRVIVGGSSSVAGALLLGGALLSNSLVAFSVLLLLASTVSGIAIPGLTAALADVVGAESRGVGFAFSQILLTAGAALSPAAIGLASDLTGSLPMALLIMIIPMALGGLLMMASRWSYDKDMDAALATSR